MVSQNVWLLILGLTVKQIPAKMGPPLEHVCFSLEEIEGWVYRNLSDERHFEVGTLCGVVTNPVLPVTTMGERVHDGFPWLPTRGDSLLVAKGHLVGHHCNKRNHDPPAQHQGLMLNPENTMASAKSGNYPPWVYVLLASLNKTTSQQGA